jgi:hypothetical protein
MPFKKIDVKATIEQQCKQDSEFKKAWEASKIKCEAKNDTTQQSVSGIIDEVKLVPKS